MLQCDWYMSWYTEHKGIVRTTLIESPRPSTMISYPDITNGGLYRHMLLWRVYIFFIIYRLLSNMYNEKLIISIFFLSKYSKSEKQIIPKSNRKIIDRYPIKHITWPLLNISRDRSLNISRDRSLSWLGTGTYIKHGSVRHITWPLTFMAWYRHLYKTWQS